MTLTPRSRSHKMLPSTLDIMWPMHQQSLILLHPMVKEKTHLQENTLLNLYLRVKVTQNVAQCPLHHVTYSATKFEVATPKGMRRCIYKKIQYLTFDLDLGVYIYIYKKIHNWIFDLDLGIKVTQNVAQYPLHHVTYSTTKFKVATSNRLRGDTFTRNVTDGRADRRRATDPLW